MKEKFQRGIIMIISGFQKLTLLDYPEKTACTLFTYGCNFRCPFCHNSLLVTEKQGEVFSEEEIFSYLIKRQGLIDGVCITGGEPTCQKDLIPFMEKIKKMGYLLKLDTNGYNPEVLDEILTRNLCDYVAMDIKNSLQKYSATAGVRVDTDKIVRSISLIKDKAKDFEFRTTVVAEHHSEEDIQSICSLAGKESKIYLQQFKDSGVLIEDGLSPWNSERMENLTQALINQGFKVSLRKS